MNGRRIREVALLIAARDERPDLLQRATPIRGGASWKNVWKDYLDNFAPRGITARGKKDSPNDINDAYRHYMSAALLTQLFGGDVTFFLGFLNEKWNDTYSPESTAMDYYINDAGISAGNRTTDGFNIDGFGAAMEFVSDVAVGKLKVIDHDTNQIRETSIRDLPKVREPYQRERTSDDFSGGRPGTMDA